ncbi:MAG: hypothetical protein WA082_03910 [Candidatus Moraniibacteriota bacterium]
MSIPFLASVTVLGNSIIENRDRRIRVPLAQIIATVLRSGLTDAYRIHADDVEVGFQLREFNPVVSNHVVITASFEPGRAAIADLCQGIAYAIREANLFRGTVEVQLRMVHAATTLV